MATTQEAVQISSIVPSLTVDDLQKSIRFYEALGFAINDRWEDKGTLLGVMMRAGSTEIGLNQDDWKKGRDRKKGIGVRLSISTTPGHVDEMARRARERRHHARVGSSRHGVEQPRVRGQRSEWLPADDLFADGVGADVEIRPIFRSEGFGDEMTPELRAQAERPGRLQVHDSRMKGMTRYKKQTP